MTQYRKRPVVVTAHQWFKNGDHPLDNATEMFDYPSGPLPTDVTQRPRVIRTGAIVRPLQGYHPGENLCKYCEADMVRHGWIDTLEGGHIVCPGDYIITGIKGEHYSCKPDIFAATYEPVPVPPLDLPEPEQQALAARVHGELYTGPSPLRATVAAIVRRAGPMESQDRLIDDLVSALAAQPVQQPAPVADERAAFEAWCYDKHPVGGPDRGLTKYANSGTQWAWDAWQARAALAAPVAAPVDVPAAGAQPDESEDRKQFAAWVYDSRNANIRTKDDGTFAHVEHEHQAWRARGSRSDVVQYGCGCFPDQACDVCGVPDSGRDAALVKASQSILEACETGAAPFKVEYALDKLKESKLRVDLDPDLLLALFSALAAASLKLPHP